LHDKDDVLALTAQIVSAHAGAHKASPDELAEMLATVHAALLRAQSGVEGTAQGQGPAVPIEESLRDVALVCIEDGLGFPRLKRPFLRQQNP